MAIAFPFSPGFLRHLSATDDDPAILADDPHPPVDLAEDLDRFRADIAGYLKPEDIAQIEAAYHFSSAAHRGQFRISGEPYISHPLAVAGTVASWRLDPQALIAALLHDVMEDAEITKEQLTERFGKIAAELVDGVSKLDRIENQSYEEAQAENFRKMLLAMARDVRVILIKLADRLHNMRTLDAVRPDKRRRIARETLEIYAPIANRLGLNDLYRELQELSFRHLYPRRHRVLLKAVRQARGNRREVVGKILDAIHSRLPAAGIDAEVIGREKHLYGIYRKMREKRLTFSQVLDIYGFRIIVKDAPTCYLTLGVLHGLFKPVPGKIKDYIAIPKANGYQSLHTTLIGPYGTPVEIQIRTSEMNHLAESGVASHWLYKDEQAMTDFQQATHKWLQSLLELQSASGNSAEFLEHVKVDLFSDEVYVFTPRGKILSLPRGATPVDFAYAVHTDIGNRCIACRINFESMPLRTELKSGDRVEIITALSASPHPNWLSYVVTGKARAQIRYFLKTQQQEESAALGERLLGQALRTFGISGSDIDNVAWEPFLREIAPKDKRQVLTEIGLGTRLPAIVARRLIELRERWESVDTASAAKARPATPILIRGTEGVTVQLAKCCRPIPGDPIVGIIRKGQGLIVHTNDCALLVRQRSGRNDWVDVDWETDVRGPFEAALRVVTANRHGILARITLAIAGENSDIVNVSMDDDGGQTTSLYFTLQVQNRAHLASILRRIRRIPEVVRTHRIKD
jgi:guanosine-3',5'-bis(diphosphate) 3'-pyrophosphohydrolase